MLIATCAVGDLAATLYQVTSLEPADQRDGTGTSYLFQVQDLPTGRTHQMNFMHENPAIMAFAVWLVMDEANVGALEGIRASLQESLPNWAMP